MVWVGRNPKDHLVQHSCHEQRCHSLKEIAQGTIQLGLEQLVGEGIGYIAKDICI